MRIVVFLGWVGFAGLAAAAGLACSSVPAPTGWETDVSPAKAAPGASTGPGPSAGTSGAPSSPDVEDASVAPDPGDPIYNTPVQCSSGTQWTQGDTGSDKMQPGAACRSCHLVGGSASKKSFDVSGTVYATAHEPNNCDGVNVSGATVVITAAGGATTSFPVNAAGNFYHDDFFGFAGIAKPFKAKVVFGGKQRAMVGAISDGDCNKCHSVTGTSLAPGRIMLP